MNLTWYEKEIEHKLFNITPNLQLGLKFGYYSISLISIFGNFLIIYVVIKNKRMHNVTNYFITNLALVDIIISLFSTPFQVNLSSKNLYLFKISIFFYS